MLCLRRRFHPALTRIVASAALAWMGSVALASASQAAAVTFNYTGSDVSYTSAQATTESQFTALKEGARPGAWA
jgi:hypothetical protein